MKSQVIKRSIVIEGRKTSISIEDGFWECLKAIAKEKTLTVSGLVGTIKASRPDNSNLSSAIRVYILSHLRARMTALLQGHSGPSFADVRHPSPGSAAVRGA